MAQDTIRSQGYERRAAFGLVAPTASIPSAGDAYARPSAIACPVANDGRLEADYLIIGNSAAGVAAAETLRACDGEASILMVSDEPYAAYGRPLISYLLEGKTSIDRVGYRDAGFYDRNRIATLFGAACKVVSIDPEAHEAACADGTVIRYGKCLLATGSVAFVPHIEGMEGRANVHRFMTLDDALGAWEDAVESTRRAHDEGCESRVIVIGGGLIGAKAAEALSHHVDEVVVFEHNNRILPAVLDEEGAGIVQRLLEPHGIVCRPGMSAEALVGEGDRVVSAHLTDGSDLPCDMVVMAVGVRPASSLAVDAGAEQGRGLVVGRDLQTTLPDVYAAGDVTQVSDRLTGAQRPLALWPNAVHQGRIAALHMAGVPDAPDFVDSFAVNAVDFFDISLLTSGIINPSEGDGCEVHTFVEGDEYAKFVVRGGALVGYVLLNRPDDAGVYTSMIEDEVPLSSLEGDVFSRPVGNLDFSEDVRWRRLHKGYPGTLDEFGWSCDPGVRPDSGTDSGSGTDFGTGPDCCAGRGVAFDSGVGAAFDSGASADSDPVSSSDSGADPNPDSSSGSGSGSDPDTSSKSRQRRSELLSGRASEEGDFA
ncbi:NAD(P)/FAD-dependent oxidoreductase [Slackia equolifaciens]|nr:FAD-dependent oxidoreductase [Slackia equolifaciens]